jgi:hypothetical protein
MRFGVLAQAGAAGVVRGAGFGAAARDLPRILDSRALRLAQAWNNSANRREYVHGGDDRNYGAATSHGGDKRTLVAARKPERLAGGA